MEFSLLRSLEILERTPAVLSSLLEDLSAEWIDANEGENTWTPKEVVAHLIVCEKTNWLTRAKIILSENHEKNFTPINMEMHFELSKHRSLHHLLPEFAELRKASIKEITDLHLDSDHLAKTAYHPVIGEVSLQQLIATWVAHDLSHIAQITRVMAKQYTVSVGPFERYLRFLKQ